MVSLDLLELNASPKGLQDNILNTIKVIPIQLSTLLEPSNKILNTALYANKILIKPSANFILLKGFK